MKKHSQTFNRVLETIDWRKIKAYHAKLGIRWEYKIDKEVVYKTPTIPELKSELSSILQHMIDENMDYISYGSWVVFWDRESTGDMRVIFRVADFSFEDSANAKEVEEIRPNKEKLMAALDTALKEENYEYAAKLRDEINRKNANNNLK